MRELGQVLVLVRLIEGKSVVGWLSEFADWGVRLEAGWIIETAHAIEGLDKQLAEYTRPGEAIRGVVLPWRRVEEVVELDPEHEAGRTRLDVINMPPDPLL